MSDTGLNTTGHQSSQYFRFFTAAFSHYSLAHLASNSLVLLVLGTVFEKRCHSRHFFVLTLVVVVTTVMSLHFFLPEYVAYAGISCLNFALMGWLLSVEGARNPAGSIAALALLVSYEFYVVVSAEKTFDTIQPAWQLHLLAFIEGDWFLLVPTIRPKGAIRCSRGLMARCDLPSQSAEPYGSKFPVIFARGMLCAIPSSATNLDSLISAAVYSPCGKGIRGSSTP